MGDEVDVVEEGILDCARKIDEVEVVVTGGLEHSGDVFLPDEGAEVSDSRKTECDSVPLIFL